MNDLFRYHGEMRTISFILMVFGLFVGTWAVLETRSALLDAAAVFDAAP